MSLPRKINKDFFKTWNAEMAYVLGFIAADGYITHTKRGTFFWNIQITDLELLEKIKYSVHSDHKIGVRLRGGNEETIYRLQVGSKEMCSDLRKLGMVERKTKNLFCPDVPTEFLSDFVRGYFDGDGNVWIGYVHKERKVPLRVIRTVFTSCSKSFLEKLKEQLKKVDIEKGVLSASKGNYYRLTYSVHGSLKLYDFMYNQNAQKPPELFLSRKKDVFKRYLK